MSAIMIISGKICVLIAHIDIFRRFPLRCFRRVNVVIAFKGSTKSAVLAAVTAGLYKTFHD